MEMELESQSFFKRLMSMIKVDFRRMFTMKLFYIILGIVVALPILILVMTSSMKGTTHVDPKTGVETISEGFDNTWQIVETISTDTSSTDSSSGSMDMTSMGNINMLYFAIAIFVCTFISQDFKSGYSKTLFTRRSKKGEYVISKFLSGFFVGALLILAWTIGAVIGGAISGLSFDLGRAGIQGLAMCLIAKALLMSLFVSIYLMASVVSKQKVWMALTGSFMMGMLLFMMVPKMTPLDSGIGNVFMCLIGGGIFSIVFGLISNVILNKLDIV